jgi:hypothetical protein
MILGAKLEICIMVLAADFRYLAAGREQTKMREISLLTSDFMLYRKLRATEIELGIWRIPLRTLQCRVFF